MLVVQSYPTLCDPMDCSHQVPPSMGFPRQEYWNGLPCHPPGDPPHPGIKTGSPALQADSLPTELRGKPEDGRLAPQNNHLFGVWMPGSLLDQR